MACSALVTQFALCLQPKPLICLRIDFRMVRINEILRMYHNLMVIHNLMSLSCTDYNYNIFRVLEFGTAVLRITEITAYRSNN